MGMECEHPNGDYMGKCAICEDMVCGECFQTIFNTIICGEHKLLEDESSWELLGVFSDPAQLEEKRAFFQDQGITSIAVESEEDTAELYVPIDEKDDAFEASQGVSEDTLQCDTCKVYFSKDTGTCPICGVQYVEEEI
jgi:hypothetical protein